MTRDYIKDNIDTLRGKLEAKYKASGRTTVQVDEYVQKLFKGKIGEWIALYDHSGVRIGNVGLYFKLCKRMETEHNIQLESKRFNNSFAVRIPESIMVDMANRRAIWIEDAEHKYHELTGK